MPLETGARIDIYEVIGKLGEGAMGEVYRARDTTLDRDVALKVLPDSFTADPERLGRFQREAKVLASLNHPNIGGIYGLETSGDNQALVLELIEGPTLAERIAEGPIPVEQGLAMVRQIAEALSAAHDAGVVHRDLKPANIKVRPDGTVKVLDFGLAKAAEGGATESGSSDAATMTAMSSQAGAIIGTAAYMSPEQARGQDVDKRSDIWALGCVAYELLTSHRPFEGSTLSDTLASVLARDVDWSRLPEDVPPALHKFLTRCLQKDATKRLRDAAEGILQLEDGLAQPVVEATDQVVVEQTPLKLWQKPVPAMASVIFSLAVGLAVAAALLTPAPLATPDLIQFGVNTPGSAPLRAHPFVHDLAVSNDGTQIVYNGSVAGGSERQIIVRPMDQLVGAPIRGTDGGQGPFMSPDEAWIGFLTDGGAPNATMKKVSLFGGPPVTLVEMPAPINGASWGTDDQIVYGLFRGGLYRVSGGGGEPEPLTELDSENGQTAHSWPSIIPDRDAVLFTISYGGTLSTGQLAVLDLSDGSVKELGLAGFSPQYVSTGHLIYAAEDASVRGVPFDINDLAIAGNPVPLLEDVTVKNTGAANFSISDDGRLVFAVGAGGNTAQSSLVWVDRDGQEEALPVESNNFFFPRISPDGSQVATMIGNTENVDIWVSDVSRGTLTNVTTSPAGDYRPLWSPDGTRVVFVSNRDTGQDQIFWRLADGTGPIDSLFSEEHRFMVPSTWSMDGNSLVFSYVSGDEGISNDIGIVSLDGNWDPLLVTPAVEAAPAISPDGNWIAYHSNQTGRSEVYVERFPNLGERVQVSTGGGRVPLWAPDGTELYYRSPSDNEAVMAVPIDLQPTFTPGTPTLLFTGNYRGGPTGGSPNTRHYDISPHGDRFLMIKLDALAQEEVDILPPITVILNWFEELTERVPFS